MNSIAAIVEFSASEGAFRDAATRSIIDPARLANLIGKFGKSNRRAALLTPLANILTTFEQKGKS